MPRLILNTDPIPAKVPPIAPPRPAPQAMLERVSPKLRSVRIGFFFIVTATAVSNARDSRTFCPNPAVIALMTSGFLYENGSLEVANVSDASRIKACRDPGRIPRPLDMLAAI